MSERIFLDTSGWLAAVSQRDQHHKAALAAYEKFITQGAVLVTTNLVVAEMHILTTRRRGVTAGLELLRNLHHDPAHEIVYVDRDLERNAIDRWLGRFTDHRLSLTDAVSFEVMDQQGINQAFAFDNHFKVAGFQTMR